MRLLRFGLLALGLVGAIGCGRKVTSIEISPKKVRIYGVDGGQRLTAGVLDRKGRPIDQATVTWSSSKTNVATVDASGRVTAKGAGKALVTAKCDKVSAQVPVEVVDVKTIEIAPVSLNLIGPPGLRFPLQAVTKNSKGIPVEIPVQWSSMKPSVATVDSRGVVTSVAPGVATIVVKLGDLQAACDAAVIFHDIAQLELRPATAILHAGEVQKFDVVGRGADGKAIENLTTTFRSSDPTVARVDALGLATGVAPGTATIRASLGTLDAEATLLVN